MANYDRVLGDEGLEKQNFGWTAPKHHTGKTQYIYLYELKNQIILN